MQEVRQPLSPPGIAPGAGTGRIRDDRSIGELIRGLATDTRELLQGEVRLAKAEMSQKAAKYVRNGASIATGGAIAFAGVITLCIAASAGLYVGLMAAGLDASVALWLGPLIVGIVVGVIGYALIQKGISTIKHESITPERTTQSLRETTQWMHEKVS
jgi:hypothetical protein